MTPAEKIRARSAVMIAVENGTLAKPESCEGCGKACSPHGHHDDYTKPLAVRWLCLDCHWGCHRPPARPGRGRAILFRLDDDVDEKLEAARKSMGLDRVSYTRMILTERLNADARMSA